MKYLGNAFSLNMLCGPDGYLRTKELSLEEVTEWLRDPLELTPWQSVVGHEDTARILTRMLRTPIEFNRKSVQLEVGDELLVGQYSGPRLPEGTTSLPQGASVKWVLVKVYSDRRFFSEYSSGVLR